MLLNGYPPPQKKKEEDFWILQRCRTYLEHACLKRLWYISEYSEQVYNGGRPLYGGGADRGAERGGAGHSHREYRKHISMSYSGYCAIFILVYDVP